MTTRMASEGSVPALQALRAAVRLSTCGDAERKGQRLAPGGRARRWSA